MKDIQTITRQDVITTDHKLETYKVGRYKIPSFAERDLYAYRYTRVRTADGEKKRLVEEGFCWPVDIREFRKTHHIKHTAWQFRAESRKTGRVLEPFRAFTTGKGPWQKRVKITHHPLYR